MRVCACVCVCVKYITYNHAFELRPPDSNAFIFGITLANAIAIKSLGDDVVRNTCSLARIKYLTLEKTSSSGIKSGLYGGRKRIKAPELVMMS